MKKPDFNSIRFRMLVYFILFAVALTAIIWGLQYWFLDNQYEDMKKQETARIATKIRTEYEKSDQSGASVRRILENASHENDLKIFIRSEDGFPLFDTRGILGDWSGFNSNEEQIQTLTERLRNSSFDSTTMIYESEEGSRTLEYACYITPRNQNGAGSASGEGQTRYIMYIFSPLYPVKSTISILRIQLVYITIIALILSVGLALLLSRHLTRPIRDITDAAAEMGRGNYSVKFHGGPYTELSELAETLTLTENEMEKTGQYQSDMIANVSHDLRTPLTMIRSYAEMIRDISGNNPEKRDKHLQVIIDEADRLNTLVNDMLNLSKMQSKRMVLLTAPFDLKAAAESVLSSYEILKENEGYDIRFTSPRGPLMVDADEPKIKQVMNNLMTNAVKYCGDDKVILVSLKRTGRKVRFSVQDHGMGIAPEELPHVWDKYYKASTHHVRSTEGTGLGLSIVKEILTLHRAQFDVKSTVGKGSTFWFELPLLKMPSRRGRQQNVEPATFPDPAAGFDPAAAHDPERHDPETTGPEATGSEATGSGTDPAQGSPDAS